MSKKCLAILLSAVMLATSGAAWPSTVRAEEIYIEDSVEEETGEESEPEIEEIFVQQEEELAGENDSADNAIQISTNRTYRDNCVSSSDDNWYQFTISGSSAVSLSFGKEYDSNTSHSWAVRLYDSSQKEMMYRRFYCGTEMMETTCKVGVPAGTYYLRVEPYIWTDVAYKFQINSTGSGAWETEFNDSVDTADSLNTGSTCYGSSRENNDEDYYKVSIAQSGYVSLSFGKEYDSNTSHSWAVRLYDSAHKEMLYRRFYCGNETTETTCKVGVPAGTYYVRVSPYIWTDVTYNLKVNYTSGSSWESEFNNTPDTADSLNTGSICYGSSMENDDEDYYKISIEQAGYVSLSFGKEYDSNTSHSWAVRLYDSTHKEMLYRRFYCGNETTETTCKIGVSAGTYYIRVSPYIWTDVTYNLTVNYSPDSAWETEFNDTVDTADVMEEGTKQYGSSKDDDDVDYYKIQITQSGYRGLSFDNEYESDGYKSWYVILYNEAQEEVAKDRFYSKGTSENGALNRLWLSTGTYYLKVSPYSWTDVTYSLQLNQNLSTPTITMASNTSSGIYLKWSRVSGATEYDIYRRSTGSWTKIQTISSGSQTNYTDTTVKNKNGTTYYYFIVASNDQVISDASTTKKIVRVINPTMSTAKNVTGRKIYAKWTKNTKASGYQVQYSRSKSFSSGNRTYTRTGSSAVSTTMSGLSKGKTYYVRVRAYRTVGGIKYYSVWSSAKSVKITK